MHKLIGISNLYKHTTATGYSLDRNVALIVVMTHRNRDISGSSAKINGVHDGYWVIKIHHHPGCPGIPSMKLNSSA